MMHDASLAVLVLRWALFLSMMLLAGVPWFAAWAMRQSWHQELKQQAHVQRTEYAETVLRWPWLGRGLAGMACMALLASTVYFTLTVQNMAGIEWAELELATLQWVALQTPLGWAWLVRSVLLLGVLALLVQRHQRGLSHRDMQRCCVLAAVAIATLPWNGHAGVDASAGWGDTFQLAADVLHLWAAAAWCGALAGFVWLLADEEPMRRPGVLLAALRNFAWPGALIVGTLAVTGVVRIHDLVGWTRAAWMDSTYAQWLMFKLALFSLMLVLAALNRWSSSNQSDRPTSLAKMKASGDGPMSFMPRRGLRLRVVVELAALVMITDIVAVMGTTMPPGL